MFSFIKDEEDEEYEDEEEEKEEKEEEDYHSCSIALAIVPGAGSFAMAIGYR